MTGFSNPKRDEVHGSRDITMYGNLYRSVPAIYIYIRSRATLYHIMSLPIDFEHKLHTLLDFYQDLTYHIVPGPNSSCYFIPFLLLPSSLLIPQSVLSHQQLCFSILPLIYACQIHAWYTIGIDVISINLSLWSFVLLALRDPRRTHRRVWVCVPSSAVEETSEWAEGQVVEEPYPIELTKRIPWVLTLLVSLRLTGWRIDDASHDKTQPPRRMSRRRYLNIALGTIAYSYLILDATSCYVRIDPYFFMSGMSVDAPYPPPSNDMPTVLVLLRLLPPRLLRSSILAGQIYAMVTSMFYLPTLPAVGLNFFGFLPDEWSPHTWPVFFGNFSAVGERGLRGLWGSWWHGMNRQITATPGRALAQALGIPTRSVEAYALLTLSAFFFSGVIHMGTIPPEPKSTKLSANEMRLCIAICFWAQVPAFGIEMEVSKVIARFAPQLPQWRASEMVILAWTAGWLSLTLPILTDPFREIGYWTHHAVPSSLLRGLAGKGWITW